MTFQASYSLFWVLLLLPLSFGLAWYFYRDNSWLKTQSKTVQRILPVLRGLGLFLLMLMLLKITLLLNQSTVERPALITLLDNSSSIKRFEDSGSIAQQLNKFKEKVNDQFGNRYDLYFYSIGSQIKENGEVLLNEEESNLELAFKHLSEQYLNRNIGAVLFATDGNYNTGDNPTYAAEQLSLTPIISLGIGDTTPKRDHLIGNMYYNDVVFLNDIFPIEVDIEAFKIKNTKAVVRLINQGKTIQSKTVEYKNEPYAFRQVGFQVEAQKTGFQAYTVSIEYLQGEHSRTNNSKTCYVEIIDSRNSICFVATAPHPDLAAMRSAAESNENYQTTVETPQTVLNKKMKPDLVVWHGPNLPNDQPTIDYFIKNKIPVLFVIPGNVSNGTINGLDLFNFSNQRGQLDEVQASLNAWFTSFELQ
ncbi:MAG: hypothetical protein ACKO7O_04450 [Bacteroidota bacterium]